MLKRGLKIAIVNGREDQKKSGHGVRRMRDGGSFVCVCGHATTRIWTGEG